MIIEKNIHILHHTDHTLVVWKPKGISCEFRYDVDKQSLVHHLERTLSLPRVPRLPHRIDRVTSGIVVMGLSDQSIRYYNNEVREGTWEKFYLARISPAEGLDPYTLIGMHKSFLTEKKGKAIIVRSGGKPSFLSVLDCAPAPERKGEFHLLIQLHTGRFHQIRAMLAGAGAPLTGDMLYDGPGSWDDFYLEHAVLVCRDFETGNHIPYFLKDCPEREALGQQLIEKLQIISQEKPI